MLFFVLGKQLKKKLEGKTFSVLKKQMRDSIDKKFNSNNIFIAYEPIWSIGTGKIPKIQELKNIFKFIKGEFKKNFSKQGLFQLFYMEVLLMIKI